MSKVVKTIDNKEVIPVVDGEIGGIKQPVVDGRTLHAAMGVSRDFTTWMKKRISDYGFQKGVDYVLTKTGEQLPSGTKYSCDYALTLEMAKELAMIERNDMGRKIRRYFIQCERDLLMNQCANMQRNEKIAERDREKEDREFCHLHELTTSRVLYWAIKKRDHIYQPGMDHDLLFSILEDIQASIYKEHIRSFKRKFPFAYSSEYFLEMKSFIKNWTPVFFTNSSAP
ncbi:antA/AntB antirepressor family protein [Methylicorpusculum sp.]|uniref:antA/AntB antirepressor family protein n=1 Tax=Methylicorpusculum sp. TaxID=2713644 RepID=UPI002720E1E3|nr:antA/AntB antirepressor family protein [Methylicorpusculum sp.]MDO8845583.1 antA/AntB antirepressor family protein [Methylicorpusculum sp.]